MLLSIGLLAPCSCSIVSTPAAMAPTLVLHGGRIWTGVQGAREVSAIAIDADRIALLGTDTEVLALIGEDTLCVDLRGRRVVPGFIDSHVHLLSGGEGLLGGDHRDAATEAELARRLGDVARELPPGAWITAGTWDHENWPGGKLPTRLLLDRFTPDHPVFISRLDGHMALANSVALRLAGVTAETAAPAGGTIVKDTRTGEPTGVLKDTAMGLVSRHIPPPSREELLRRARAALRHAASLGVTGVHDMLGSYSPLGVYQELRDRGELTLRVTAYTPIELHERWRRVDVRRGFGDSMLKVNGVKAFADGSLGASTALLFDAYVDAPETYGLAVTSLAEGGEMERQVQSCVDAGLQVATHAIGDRAIHEMLDIYSRVRPGKTRELRLRIEHSQHIHPNDLPRYAELGVIASMQPFHCYDDGKWAQKRIGPARARTTYAFRDLIDLGAPLAFGSDWPVATLSPLAGIYAAVTRHTNGGGHPDGWIPEQKISVEEALRAYTAGSAWAAHDENHLGTLEVGKLADLVVLDRDVLAITAPEVRDVRVDMTIVGGRIVHEAR